jgi:hypothetical protein
MAPGRAVASRPGHMYITTIEAPVTRNHTHPSTPVSNLEARPSLINHASFITRCVEWTTRKSCFFTVDVQAHSSSVYSFSCQEPLLEHVVRRWKSRRQRGLSARAMAIVLDVG